MTDITPDLISKGEEPTSTHMVGNKDNTGALAEVEYESRNSEGSDQRSGNISQVDSTTHDLELQSGLCNTALNELPSLDLPPTQKTKILIVINLQNSFVVQDRHYLTNNRDFIPRLKEAILYFRKGGGIVCWVCTDPDQESRLHKAGVNGAEMCGELLDVVDKEKDLIVTKHHHSAFDQTSLIMALRMHLTTEIYLCGLSTNVDIYTTAADAVQHGLHVTVIEDCLGFRSVKKHIEAMRRMADYMGVDVVESEGVIIESGGRLVPDVEPFGDGQGRG
jgi:nicotinamidase-related amidase